MEKGITMAQVLGADIDRFAAGFGGQLFTPGQPGYDEARRVWNGSIDRRPAVIARCGSAADVAGAIRFAREAGLEISIRGGAHNFAGFAVRDGALMIDLSGMRSVTVRPEARRAVVAGGATWADLDGAAQEHGLAVTGGFISHTGVGGLTLGGGMGWLTPLAGLTIDNLVAAEVVTADGRTLRASDDENGDLFWALRGGGGNFGVVTSFEFRLHSVGPIVNLALFFWGLDRGAEALRYSRDLVPTLPDDVGVLIAALSAPPAPFVPENHHFAPGYALLLTGLGAPGDHAALVAKVRAEMPPLFDLVTPIPYAQLQQMFDEANCFGRHGYEKALYLDDLHDAAIDVITDHAPRRTSPLSFVPMFVLSGAYGRAGDADTAFGGSRRARYGVNIAAICPGPELFEAERAWVRAFWEALRPHAADSGSYVNFMSEYEEDRVRAAYGDAKYGRLSRIKADYDPDNVFRLNANIKPAVPV